VELVSIRENEVTVELRWEDLKLLIYALDYAKQHDAMGSANDWGMAKGRYIPRVNRFTLQGQHQARDTELAPRHARPLAVPVSRDKRSGPSARGGAPDGG
jgi:hypothetical protein